MTLRGQVNHGFGLVPLEDSCERGAVADVGLVKGVALGPGDVAQGLDVAGVGQLVDVDHRGARVAEQISNDGRTDESSAAGDESSHGWARSRVCTQVDAGYSNRGRGQSGGTRHERDALDGAPPPNRLIFR